MRVTCKVKCYFAHPWSRHNSNGEKRIMSILRSRGVEVINPFDGEDEVLQKYGIEKNSYYYKPIYKLAREIWIKDLKQIESCDMLLVWLPEKSIGTPQEISYAYHVVNRLRKRDGKPPIFIQIISSIKHPSFAYYLTGGNQYFSSISAFEHLKPERWEDHET